MQDFAARYMENPLLYSIIIVVSLFLAVRLTKKSIKLAIAVLVISALVLAFLMNTEVVSSPTVTEKAEKVSEDAKDAVREKREVVQEKVEEGIEKAKDGIQEAVE